MDLQAVKTKAQQANEPKWTYQMASERILKVKMFVTELSALAWLQTSATIGIQS
jgi:hypothetical protein